MMAEDPWMAMVKALDAVYCSGAVDSVEDAQVATDAVLFSLRQSGYVLAPAEGLDVSKQSPGLPRA